MTMPLLEVRGLRVTFPVPGQGFGRDRSVAVAGADVTVGPEETVAIVGESGSGKSTVARSVVGLQRPDAGELIFDGRPLLRRRRAADRRAIQMVFQDPASSLNPRMRVADLINEAWQTHPAVAPAGDRREAIAAALGAVGLSADLVDRYPGQLSGGQCQRVSIARALALQPRLLVCDEAVSALDVSVQTQVLRLLADLRAQRELAMIFISHDLAVVRQIADRVLVMKSGEIVETGMTEDLFNAPQHPYTQALLDAALDLKDVS
ncbi:ATP-binding cassette domain-containing protein [Microlunatus sp. GCM10028923]|uniref:ATP-binding cassette domain-containing protein n=1 Tax=Microlunatus sp. GCM10028923 TaxID=3273400 RepID=UPI0036109B80